MPKKNNTVNKNVVHDMYKKFNGWQQVIDAAKREVIRAQVAEREMKAVIRLFTEKLRAGEPWPGSDAYEAGTAGESIPA